MNSTVAAKKRYLREKHVQATEVWGHVAVVPHHFPTSSSSSPDCFVWNADCLDDFSKCDDLGHCSRHWDVSRS